MLAYSEKKGKRIRRLIASIIFESITFLLLVHWMLRSFFFFVYSNNLRNPLCALVMPFHSDESLFIHMYVIFDSNRLTSTFSSSFLVPIHDGADFYLSKVVENILLTIWRSMIILFCSLLQEFEMEEMHTKKFPSKLLLLEECCRIDVNTLKVSKNRFKVAHNESKRNCFFTRNIFRRKSVHWIAK